MTHPEPLVISWAAGGTIRVRHDDERLWTYSPVGDPMLMGMPRGSGIVSCTLIVLLLAGCTGSGSGPARSASSPVPAPTTAADATAVATAIATGATTDGIIGIGATDAAWGAHHVEDPRYAAGSSYDPTLGPDPDHNDRYYAVQRDRGRVFLYDMRLPHGTTIAAARDAAVAEMPTDAKLVWFRTLATCAQAEFESTLLAHGMGDAGNPRGGVLAEFTTETTTGDLSYSSSNANSVLMLIGANPTKADAPDC